MNYKFEIKTGDQQGAGTDSNIFLVLYGEFGQTPEVRLNGHISGNAFERNQTDSFSIDFGDDIGRVYRVELRSDCKYAASDWLLSYIKITRMGAKAETHSNLSSTFHINKWVDNQTTKTFDTDYNSWTSITKFESVETPYKSYKLTIPAHSTFVYEKVETTKTSFFYRNIQTKKTTTSFTTEMGSKSDFSATAALSKELSATAASERFLKFAFSKGFESEEINEVTKTENHEIMTSVKQNVSNDTDHEQVYEVLFSLNKVNAISQMNSVIALFSANSEVVFSGFRLLSPK